MLCPNCQKEMIYYGNLDYMLLLLYPPHIYVWYACLLCEIAIKKQEVFDNNKNYRIVPFTYGDDKYVELYEKLQKWEARYRRKA